MFASNPTPYAVVTAGGQIITDLTLPFLYIALLIELTPGPNMTWLALLSLQHGRGAGLAALAGVATGLAILAVVALFALTQASGIAPQWLWVLKYVGIAYLLCFGCVLLHGEGVWVARDFHGMHAGFSLVGLPWLGVRRPRSLRGLIP